MTQQRTFKQSFFITLLFVFLLWIIKLGEFIFDINLGFLGVYPREIVGLIGIVTMPIIHGSFSHLVSNTIPLLVLGSSILYFYPKASVRAILIIYLLPSILVWFFGRESYHIGASGIIYGLAAFAFFSGLFRRDSRAISLALLVTFLYGSLVWGIFPQGGNVSWEGHLFGGLTGIIAAFIFRKYDPYKKYDWEDEEDDFDPNELKISHRRGFPYDEN
jgi:membrane associated rhomboid family serine protease